MEHNNEGWYGSKTLTGNHHTFSCNSFLRTEVEESSNMNPWLCQIHVIHVAAAEELAVGQDQNRGLSDELME